MELSEEEKKAIERLSFYKNQTREELYPTIDIEEEKAIGIVLNLIENQQKEIEELKNNELDYTTIYMNGIYDGEKKVKDKIRELLKSKDIELTGVISYRELEELL